jgi:hypothetical protein
MQRVAKTESVVDMFEQDQSRDGMHYYMASAKGFTAAASSGLGIALCAVAFVGCVDPKTDYDNWVASTVDAHVVPTVDAGVVEASLPEGGFTQTYAMACVSQIASDVISEATLFTATVTFTPSATGGGTVDFSDQTLMAGATSLSQLVGTPRTINGNPVAPDGTFDVNFVESTFPGSANPVDGEDVDIQNCVLHFHLGPGTHLCSNLSGNLITPIMTPLDPAQNICIYLPTTDQIPPMTQDMVHCP